MLRRKIPPGGTDADVSCPANVWLDQYPGPVRLGRHTSCELRCLSQKGSGEREVVNAAVSRWHAEIARMEGGGYVVRDKSANGTLVNGHRINGDHVLATGDVIILGMPTYKANLEPATEIVNPFIFEFVAEQDASAQLAREPAQEPIIAPSEARHCQNSTKATISAARNSVEALKTVPQPDAGGDGRLGMPLLDSGPSGLGDEGDNKETQPHGGSRTGLGRMPAPGGAGPSTEGSTEPFGSRPNLVPSSSQPMSAGESAPHAPVDGEQSQEGWADSRERHVGQRMREVVRAKERADAREEPSKKRRNTTPPSLQLMMMKRMKRSTPSAGIGATESRGPGPLQATGTPLSLADDCALLDIPGVDGVVGDQGLRPTFGLRFDASDRIAVDFPDSPNDPVAQDLVDIPTEGPLNTETPPLDPPRTEPAASAEPLREASTSSTAPAKDAAAAHGGEAELLDMLGEEMQCVICQNFLCAAHALPCSHTFCGDCLSQWLSKKPHCPTCRRAVGSAAPTPIHNIDSMIERAANKCMTPEEKTEFDKRRGAIKMSKKLEPTPPNTAAAPSSARARAIRIVRPAPTVDELRSGTLQAVSARLDEAMTSLSVERARELVSRVQERRRMMIARRVPPHPPPPFPFGQDAPRDPPRAMYAIDRTAAGDSRCAGCNQIIARSQIRLTKRAPEAGQQFHLGCLQGQGLVQLDQVSGMDAFSPETQNMVKAMFRARAALEGSASR